MSCIIKWVSEKTVQVQDWSFVNNFKSNLQCIKLYIFIFRTTIQLHDRI